MARFEHRSTPRVRAHLTRPAARGFITWRARGGRKTGEAEVQAVCFSALISEPTDRLARFEHRSTRRVRAHLLKPAARGFITRRARGGKKTGEAEVQAVCFSALISEPVVRLARFEHRSTPRVRAHLPRPAARRFITRRARGGKKTGEAEVQAVRFSALISEPRYSESICSASHEYFREYLFSWPPAHQRRHWSETKWMCVHLLFLTSGCEVIVRFRP